MCTIINFKDIILICKSEPELFVTPIKFHKAFTSSVFPHLSRVAQYKFFIDLGVSESSFFDFLRFNDFNFTNTAVSVPYKVAI